MPEFAEYVIHGETSAGRKFRPSAFAGCSSRRTRITGRAICPTPFPVSREWLVCVVVNKALETDDPMALEFLMDFAGDYDLKVIEGRKLRAADRPRRVARAAGKPRRRFRPTP